MIRNFRDLLGNIFGTENKGEGPDLFEYAKVEGDPANPDAAPDSDERKKRKQMILVGSVAGLLPLVFASGYLTHKLISPCEELPSAGEMNPEVSSEEGTTSISISPEAGRYLGVYRVEVSGHKAMLYIYVMKTGGMGGSIRFTEWGRREIEYLKGVRVANNKITFIRSCQGLECARIGSPSVIYQVYNGTLNSEGTVIEGQYTGGQSSSNWNATRIR